jgi:hypothetical protein
MSSCCAAPGSLTSGATLCPLSGTKGKTVERETVKAIVTVIEIYDVTTHVGTEPVPRRIQPLQRLRRVATRTRNPTFAYPSGRQRLDRG